MEAWIYDTGNEYLCNHWNVPGREKPLDATTMSINGISIEIDTAVSVEFLSKLLKAVRYA